MEKVVELVFKNAGGTKKTITIKAPKDNIAASESDKVMADIVAGNVFETTGGDIAEAVEARVRTTETTIIK